MRIEGHSADNLYVARLKSRLEPHSIISRCLAVTSITFRPSSQNEALERLPKGQPLKQGAIC